MTFGIFEENTLKLNCTGERQRHQDEKVLVPLFSYKQNDRIISASG